MLYFSGFQILVSTLPEDGRASPKPVGVTTNLYFEAYIKGAYVVSINGKFSSLFGCFTNGLTQHRHQLDQ
jgi:hypothetical protein